MTIPMDNIQHIDIRIPIYSPVTAPRDGKQFVAWAKPTDGGEARWMIVQWAMEFVQDKRQFMTSGSHERIPVKVLGWVPLPWNDGWGW